MKTRVITAVVGALAVLGLVYLGGWFLTAAVFIVSLISLAEYARMMKHIQIHIYAGPAAVAQFLMIGAAGFYSLRLFIAAIFVAFMAMLLPVLTVKKEHMQALIYTVFGGLYFGIGFGALAYLRGTRELIHATSVAIEPGIFLILFTLIGTWAGDSFALLVGRKFGAHKMAPHISPNKTVEGLLGGIAGTVILCTALAAALRFHVGTAFAMSLVVAVLAPMGDLVESYIKRACDIKDSGNILPGHGGMMDRFDSLLFAAPSVVAFLVLVMR